jgi:hypothetical protein
MSSSPARGSEGTLAATGFLYFLRGASSPQARSIGFWGPSCPGHDAQGGPCRSLRLGGGPGDCLFIRLLQFPRPHHVLRPRDRYRTITPLLLIGVLPEPVHAALSDAEISTITQLARVPGKELPQEAPSGPVPICPPPALADLHDAHPHPGFTMWQHSAHVEKPPVLHNAPAPSVRHLPRSRLTNTTFFCIFREGQYLAAIDATIFGPGGGLGDSGGLTRTP